MPITLTYFPMYARAEKVRLALTVCGVEFVDNRLEGDVNKAFRDSDKCEYGGLPVLELEDGTCLAQANAILRYIENRWGKNGGLQQNDDPLVFYKADSLREYFNGDFIDKHWTSMCFSKLTGDELTAAWDEKLAGPITKALDIFESKAPEEEGKFFLGDKISMIDIFMGGWFALIYQSKEEDPILYAKEAIRKLIEARPKTNAWSKAFRGGVLKEYLANRPECKF